MVILNLPPEVEERLQKNAAEAGLTPEQYLIALLERPVVPQRRMLAGGNDADSSFSQAEREAFENEPMPTTPADIVKYWDRVGARPAFTDRPEDSPELARKFRRDAESRNVVDPSRQLDYSSSSTIVRKGTGSMQSQLLTRLKAELDAGEKLLWTGAPIPRRALRNPWVQGAMICAVLTLALIAMYLLLDSRFFLGFCAVSLPFAALCVLGYTMEARLNARTLYAISNRRALIFRGCGELTVHSIQPHEIGQINRTELLDGSGSVVFATEKFRDAAGNLGVHKVTFEDIPEVGSVEKLLRTLSKAPPQ